MKIRLEPSGGMESIIEQPTVEIGLRDDHLGMDNVIESLIKPALMAWGFQPQTVDDYFRSDNLMECYRELFHAVGKLAAEETEAWRLAHPELMDAYQAIEEDQRGKD